MQRLIHRDVSLYFIVACVSLCLSWFLQYHNPIINPDGICYLTSASIANQGLSAMMSLCDQSKWPFYSLLIAGFAKLVPLSLEQAAFLLNALFSTGTVLIFIRIVACFTDKKSILWFAGIAILLFHSLNTLRPEIVRDHGFWFFYLGSVFYLLQFVRHYFLKYALAWSASLLLASLFRIEGILFLAFLPWVIWFDYKHSLAERIGAFFKINSLLIIAGISFVVVYYFNPHIPVGRLAELPYHFTHFYTKFIQHYIAVADSFGDSVLGRSVNDRYVIYFLALAAWYSFLVVTVLSLVYSIFFIFALKKKLLPINYSSFLVLFSYLAINLFMTFIFLIENQFLSKRYLMAFSFICLLWVPFALDYIYQQRITRKWTFAAVLLMLIGTGVSGIGSFGHSKAYVKNAGEWLKINAPLSAKIYSNDEQLLYYTDHFGVTIFNKSLTNLDNIKEGQWKKYDYLAIRITKKSLSELTILQNIPLKPIVVFNNKHGDQVRVYSGSSQ